MNINSERVRRVLVRCFLTGSLSVGMILMAGCGSSDSEAPAAEAGSKQGGGTVAAQPKQAAVDSGAKPTEGLLSVDADVVGVRIGMSESAVRTHLESEGWELKTHRTKIANIPGMDPLEYPDVLVYERRTPKDDYEDFEVIGVHFLAPVPPEEARIYIMTFDRRSVPIGTPANRSINNALTVTPEYSNSMLALVKKKYGEPDAVHEGACETRGGTVVESIPTYEVHYFTNVRAYGDAALVIKIGDACRQRLDMRMEDGDWARWMRKRFADFSQEQLDKVSASSDREVDF